MIVTVHIQNVGPSTLFFRKFCHWAPRVRVNGQEIFVTYHSHEGFIDLHHQLSDGDEAVVANRQLEGGTVYTHYLCMNGRADFFLETADSP